MLPPRNAHDIQGRNDLLSGYPVPCPDQEIGDVPCRLLEEEVFEQSNIAVRAPDLERRDIQRAAQMRVVALYGNVVFLQRIVRRGISPASLTAAPSKMPTPRQPLLERDGSHGFCALTGHNFRARQTRLNYLFPPLRGLDLGDRNDNPVRGEPFTCIDDKKSDTPGSIIKKDIADGVFLSICAE